MADSTNAQKNVRQTVQKKSAGGSRSGQDRKKVEQRKRRRKWNRTRRKILRFLYSPMGKILGVLLLILLLVCVIGGVRRVSFDIKAGKITAAELKQCKDKQEYLDAVMPIYKEYCKRFHIKYPGILALQVFHEVGSGFPQELSDVAIADNNLGGLKYGGGGIPRSTLGAPCPEDEGGNYCHFKTVGDYFYAQCWQVGQSLYDNVRKHQDSVEDFSRTLCNLWIGGVEGSEPYGYSESLIEDYREYHLEKYEN
ncbi:MAG: hypothetical protein Q4B22_11860 [Eubacteriales bacterium]|nr:hypothetical protein [Eubacteriales bacterium]